MTFFIHDPDDDRPLTVIAFDVPASTSTNLPIGNRYDFLQKMQEELAQITASGVDWRFMQAAILNEIANIADQCIWETAKAILLVEKTRPNLKRNVRAQFDFVAAYDLLHSTVYNSGSVGFAVNVLSEWLTLYEKDQFRQYQRQFLHRAGQVQNAQSLSPPNSILSSDELPPECHLDWLQQSLPFLVSLQQRSSDNQIRLKNEIDLNYSLVQQADAKAMRRISVVTMLFLPATFVSTFLSMSFFNYGADSPGDRFEWKIAPQLWIYAAIAAPLTLAAIFAWFGGYILIWLKEALLKPMNRLFWLIASEQRPV